MTWRKIPEQDQIMYESRALKYSNLCRREKREHNKRVLEITPNKEAMAKQMKHMTNVAAPRMTSVEIGGKLTEALPKHDRKKTE